MKGLFVAAITCAVLIVGCEQPKTSPTENSAPASLPEAKKTVPGPVPGTRMTEAYVAQVGRSAFFWAWPMANIYNRVQIFEKLSGPSPAQWRSPIQRDICEGWAAAG